MSDTPVDLAFRLNLPSTEHNTTNKSRRWTSTHHRQWELDESAWSHKPYEKSTVLGPDEIKRSGEKKGKAFHISWQDGAQLKSNDPAICARHSATTTSTMTLGAMRRQQTLRERCEREKYKSSFGGIVWGYDSSAGTLSTETQTVPEQITVAVVPALCSDHSNKCSGMDKTMKRSRWGVECGGPGNGDAVWYDRKHQREGQRAQGCGMRGLVSDLR